MNWSWSLKFHKPPNKCKQYNMLPRHFLKHLKANLPTLLKQAPGQFETSIAAHGCCTGRTVHGEEDWLLVVVACGRSVERIVVMGVAGKTQMVSDAAECGVACRPAAACEERARRRGDEARRSSSSFRRVLRG